MAEVHIQAVSTAQAVADSPVADSPVEEDSTAPAAAVTIVPEVTAVRAVAAGLTATREHSRRSPAVTVRVSYPSQNRCSAYLMFSQVPTQAVSTAQVS